MGEGDREGGSPEIFTQVWMRFGQSPSTADQLPGERGARRLLRVDCTAWLHNEWRFR